MNRALFKISIAGGLVSFVLFILSFALESHAVRMSNSDYIIRSEINSFGGKSTGAGGKITVSGGQTGRTIYSGTNYKVRAGFQYIDSMLPFTFSISSVEINFGTIVPGEPVARENILTVSSGASAGYQVILQEDHPLRDLSTGSEIPDTTCDAGNCSHTTAALWTSPLTYGFGYRCDNVLGADCSSGFNTANFYKQFPNAQAGEPAQVVMSGANAGSKKQAKITYKVNIPASQAEGVYQNKIKYIATPSI
jgi:hypothetical protein